MSDIQQRIVAAARACMGTPFRHQGRLPGVGLDCAGLCIVALRAAGVEMRDVKAYGRVPNEGRLQQAIDAQPGLRRIALADAGAGDVVLIRFGTEPSHVGLLSAQGCIIHAYERIGRVVEHRIDATLQLQIVAAWRAQVQA